MPPADDDTAAAPPGPDASRPGLGVGIATRLRPPGRPGLRPAPLGSVAAASTRFALAVGRPPALRRQLAGPGPVAVQRTAGVAVHPPRWWTPTPPTESGADVGAAEPTAGRGGPGRESTPAPTPGRRPATTVPAGHDDARPTRTVGIPDRGVQRMLAPIPDQDSYRPGAMTNRMTSQLVPVRRLDEVAAAGSMTTSHDRTRLVAPRPPAQAAAAFRRSTSDDPGSGSVPYRSGPAPSATRPGPGRAPTVSPTRTAAPTSTASPTPTASSTASTSTPPGGSRAAATGGPVTGGSDATVRRAPADVIPGSRTMSLRDQVARSVRAATAATAGAPTLGAGGPAGGVGLLDRPVRTARRSTPGRPPLRRSPVTGPASAPADSRSDPSSAFTTVARPVARAHGAQGQGVAAGLLPLRRAVGRAGDVTPAAAAGPVTVPHSAGLLSRRDTLTPGAPTPPIAATPATSPTSVHTPASVGSASTPGTPSPPAAGRHRRPVPEADAFVRRSVGSPNPGHASTDRARTSADPATAAAPLATGPTSPARPAPTDTGVSAGVSAAAGPSWRTPADRHPGTVAAGLPRALRTTDPTLPRGGAGAGAPAIRRALRPTGIAQASDGDAVAVTPRPVGGPAPVRGATLPAGGTLPAFASAAPAATAAWSEPGRPLRRAVRSTGLRRSAADDHRRPSLPTGASALASGDAGRSVAGAAPRGALARSTEAAVAVSPRPVGATAPLGRVWSASTSATAAPTGPVPATHPGAAASAAGAMPSRSATVRRRADRPSTSRPDSATSAVHPRAVRSLPTSTPRPVDRGSDVLERAVAPDVVVRPASPAAAGAATGPAGAVTPLRRASADAAPSADRSAHADHAAHADALEPPRSASGGLTWRPATGAARRPPVRRSAAVAAAGRRPTPVRPGDRLAVDALGVGASHTETSGAPASGIAGGPAAGIDAPGADGAVASVRRALRRRVATTPDRPQPSAPAGAVAPPRFGGAAPAEGRAGRSAPLDASPVTDVPSPRPSADSPIRRAVSSLAESTAALFAASPSPRPSGPQGVSMPASPPPGFASAAHADHGPEAPADFIRRMDAADVDLLVDKLERRLFERLGRRLTDDGLRRGRSSLWGRS